MIKPPNFENSILAPLESLFLTHSKSSHAAYQAAVLEVCDTLKTWGHDQAYSGLSPVQLEAAWSSLNLCPEIAQALPLVLQAVGESVVQHSVNVSHPTCIAHLHCPPLIPALAAEMIISATNQSMDSWDQSPAATLLEQRIVDWLCRRYGYTPLADGTFTSGGTQSNFMGMLFARDFYAQTVLNWSIQQKGLPAEASRFRILCSEVSHFTIRQSAALLGLGQQAVVPVKTNANYQMSAQEVECTLVELKQQNLIPIALVATVGTTDFGSIDPLPELAACAQQHQLWLHVDAAFGGALILSDRHRAKLVAINAADSITVDFHKLFYQPISCGAFLLKNRDRFDLLKLHADYLNPESNEDLGMLDLVTKSIQTTRRFDALKLYVSLQSLGRQGFATLIDTTIELAKTTAQMIASDLELELATDPTLNTVVFRYRSPKCPATVNFLIWSNQVNSQIRLALIQSGEAVIAQTKIKQQTYLKFTLLNPRTTQPHLAALLHRIKQLGRDYEEQLLAIETNSATNR